MISLALLMNVVPRWFSNIFSLPNKRGGFGNTSDRKPRSEELTECRFLSRVKKMSDFFVGE